MGKYNEMCEILHTRIRNYLLQFFIMETLINIIAAK